MIRKTVISPDGTITITESEGKPVIVVQESGTTEAS